jgi:hypothetical protein
MAFSGAGAIASGAGSILDGFLDYFGQQDTNQNNLEIARETNAFNERMANSAMAFSERMSDTQWQRGVADMRAAGINPMLAVSQGGASSPSGVSAVGTTGAPQQNPMRGLSQSFSSAVQAAQQLASIDNIKASTDKTQTDADLNRQLTKTSQTQAALNTATAAQAQQNTAQSAANTANIRAQLPGAQVEADIDSSTYGKVLRYLSRLNPFGHSANSIAGALNYLK